MIMVHTSFPAPTSDDGVCTQLAGSRSALKAFLHFFESLPRYGPSAAGGAVQPHNDVTDLPPPLQYLEQKFLCGMDRGRKLPFECLEVLWAGADGGAWRMRNEAWWLDELGRCVQGMTLMHPEAF